MASYPTTESNDRKTSRYIEILYFLAGVLAEWAIHRGLDTLKDRILPRIWLKIKQEQIYAVLVLWAFSCTIYVSSLYRTFTGDPVGGLSLALCALLPLICTRWAKY